MNFSQTIQPYPPTMPVIQNLSLNSIHPDPDQPRKVFDEEPLQELAQSIQEHGILSPIWVQNMGEYYQIIAGERRWRAARQAGLDLIPCIILSPQAHASHRQELALIENIQRENLTPIEEAQALKTLTQYYTHEELALKIGKKRSTVTNLLRLLDLPGELQPLLQSGQLQRGHVKLLLTLPTQEDQVKWGLLCSQKLWTVRQLEHKLKTKIKPHVTPTNTTPITAQPLRVEHDLQRISEELKGIYGTQVVINGYQQGTVEFRFYNQDDLLRLVQQFLKAF